MTIVFKISDNLKPKLIEFYKDTNVLTPPPYSVFQSKGADGTTVTLYNSGKVMFQGISADIDAALWKDQEKHINNKDIDITSSEEKRKKNEKKKLLNISSIGSDEVGTGDYFGPIVVTATFVSKNDYNFLTNLKVGDSKQISDDKIKRIAPEIIKKIPYKSFILSNKEYNNNSFNMNKKKAVLHNKVLYDLATNNNFDYEKIVVDQFCYPKNYFEYLEDTSNKITNITFMTKAEDQVLSVACASIISRYIFLKEMEKMSKELNIEIPKGSNYNVDEVAYNIAKEKGIDFLKDYVKFNFKNTDKIKEKL